MYTNTKGLREHEIKVRLNEEEAKIVEGLVHMLGTQKAVFIREMALAHIRKQLSDTQLNQEQVA